MSKTAQKRAFLPYGRQSLNKEDRESVLEVLEGDWITRGPKVKAFEEAIADYCGSKHAVAFSSGTAALQAIYSVLDVGPYDRIISTPNSFVATVIGKQRGAQLAFADIDRDSGNINLASLAQRMEAPKSRGRNILAAMHFGGIAMDMEQLELQIKDPDALIIEDACHALGSLYPDGSRVGCCSRSQLTVFSFHPLKNLTSGEGGMVTTNDAELDRRLRLFRNNGMERDPAYLDEESPGPWYYECQELTGNFHMSDIHAALGLSQLKRLGSFAEKRRTLMKEYRQQLEGTHQGIRLFSAEYDERSVYHLCSLQIDYTLFSTSRAALMEALKEEGIGTQVLYIPIYKHPAIHQGRKGKWEAQCPQMEAYYEQALAFPLFNDLSQDDVRYICAKLKSILAIG